MRRLEDFIALVHDELGLPVTVEDAALSLSELPGWDSVHLLSLVVALEGRSGQPLSVTELLDAPDLQSIYQLVS
ncbi:MAG TPA: acyl carrier protein [Amycolatopsis sp.]|uniref:acyl carrier protein n=1 Tax=Amycolatopsis sp. TaxID=37632 RepID=UPI002B4A8422|nr:acyl carrier protein [Amycolatopsis sp.]HKS43672.1 acyl carrier protein [Amycolatopsis sp.]